MEWSFKTCRYEVQLVSKGDTLECTLANHRGATLATTLSTFKGRKPSASLRRRLVSEVIADFRLLQLWQEGKVAFAKPAPLSAVEMAQEILKKIA